MKFYLLFLFLFIIGFIIYIIYENKNLEINHYKVVSKKIPKSFNGTSFVMISDLHNNSFGRNNESLLSEINKIKPSFIIIAGDMIVGKPTADFTVAKNLLSKLALRYPIYYAYGNHEQRVDQKADYYNSQWDPYLRKLDKEGVHILDNKSLKLSKNGESITITGLTIDLDFFRRKIPKMKVEDLEKLVGKLDKKCYNIVIAHNPLYFKKYIDFGADLTLSGHIHGGILRLPFLGGVISPQCELFPKYDAGSFEKDEQVMLVSRGLGTHTIKLRIFNRPELMAITLERK